MRKSYVIQWKSKVNGRAGRGTKQFAREEAQELADELNRDYPQIEHELVAAELAHHRAQAGTQAEAQESVAEPAHASLAE